jgi:hypothetical protein
MKLIFMLQQIPSHAEEVGTMAQMTRDQDVASFNR